VSTPALARCAQVIFGPFGPYTLVKSALVGRPASAYSRVPSAMLARAELLRVTGVAGGTDFGAACVRFTGFIAILLRFELFVAFLNRFDFFVISSPPWNSRTIRVFREK
jgi:hypothetical protein